MRKKKKWQEIYFDFWLKRANYQTKLKLLPVNFEKPWWDIIWQQKKLVILIFTAQTAMDTLRTVTPLIVGFILSQKQFSLLLYFIVGRIFIELLVHWAFYFNSILQLQCRQGVYYGVSKRLLSVDPVSHTTRESGKTIAKAERGSTAFENILDILTFEVVPIFAGIITIFVSFFSQDWILAVLSLVTLFGLGGVSITMQFLHANIFEKKVIEQDDAVKNTSMENLQQTAFIRSVFATNEQIKKFALQNLKEMAVSATSWRVGGHLWNVTAFSYHLGLLLIGYRIFALINSGTMEISVGIALITTYIFGSVNLQQAGEKIKRFMRTYAEITDLFDFVRKFGKQTYPVLDNTSLPIK